MSLNKKFLIVNEYIKFATYLIDRMPSAIKSKYNRNELIIVGVHGLIDAVDTHDSKNDNKFENYVTTSIKKSLLNRINP